VESGAAHGAAESRETALGWNPGGTAGAGRGVTRGMKPGGTTGAGRQAAAIVVPAVVRGILMGLTEEPDSQRKSRSVRWGEAAIGKLASSKTTCRETIRRFVERSRQRYPL
jgi:hypothetical protein